MSSQTIYNQLRNAGMTLAGACATLGNWQAESAMKSTNVQDGYGYSDYAYTEGVDAGAIDFLDGIGYGLYQLTYGPRKRDYLEYARSKGVSIGDEAAQVEYAVIELKRDYASLWEFLCSTADLYEATERVCKEFERPAVNNIGERYGYAQQFYSYFSAHRIDPESEQNEQIETEKPAEVYWPPRTLAKGMKGADVVALQGLLLAHRHVVTADGDYGELTKRAVMAYQAENGLTADGIAGNQTWTAILKVR